MDSDLEFEVMPSQKPPSKPAAPPPKSIFPRNRRIFLLALGSLLLLIASGYLIYRLLAPKIETGNAPRELPDITVPGAQTSLDTDSDGLTDQQEDELGTDPNNSDSDGDGLADGDEVNVYGSNPLLFDSDNDGFDDGREVARGFSPVSDSTELASEEETDRWRQLTEQFGLHEPTPTTLIVKKPVQTEQRSTYTNTRYGYSIELPPALTFRESGDKAQVGIYVSGTTPDNAGFATDPISISVAVLAGEQSLSDWIGQQHQSGVDYQSLESITVGEVSGIQLKGVTGETCPSDRTFFPRDGTIVILTLTCNESADFVTLYSQIISSFKFGS